MAETAQLPPDERTRSRATHRASRIFGRVPKLLWLIVALQSFLILSTGVLYTSFQEPDEIAHVDYVLAHRHGEWLDGPGERHFQLGVMQAWRLVPNTQTRPHVGDHIPFKRADRPSFDALGTGPVLTGLPNQMVQHPPLYYGVAAGFSYLVPNFSHLSFDKQIFWLRFLSLLMMIPVPIFAWLIGRRLTGRDSVGLIMAVLPLSVPSYLRIGASVSNDVPMVLFGAILLYLLARVASGDLTRRTSLLIGLFWGFTLLTKGFGLVFPPVIVLGYLLGSTGGLMSRIKSIRLPVLGAGVVGVAVGGWWWIRNVIVYHAVQTYGYGSLWPVNKLYGPDVPGGTERNFLHIVLNLLANRIFGSLGLIDLPRMPFRLLVTMVLFFLALAVAGLFLGARRSRAPRWTLLMLILPTLLTVALMYFGSRGTYMHVRQVPGIQVRYFVPFLPGITLCIAIALTWLLRRVEQWLPLVAIVFSLAFEAAAALFVLDLQVGPNQPGVRHRIWVGIKYSVGWAPWPGVVTGVFFLITGVLIIWTLAALVGWAARGGPELSPAPRQVLLPDSRGLQADAG
jgi:small subunit ribosomal protein S36